MGYREGPGSSREDLKLRTLKSSLSGGKWKGTRLGGSSGTRMLGA